MTKEKNEVGVSVFRQEAKESQIELRVGSMGDLVDRQEAVKIIQDGGCIGAQLRGVYGLIWNGFDEEATKLAGKIKGHEDFKIYSSIMPSERFLSIVDESLVHPHFAPLVRDPEKYQNIFGSICHTRAPIRADLAPRIPDWMKSEDSGKYYMHNLDPHGHWALSELIKDLNNNYVKLVGVTSLNDHSTGEAEITNLERAVEFCQSSNKLSLLLQDPTHKRQDIIGSLAIIDLENGKALRDGHIPVKIVEKIVNVFFDKEEMKDPQHPQADFERIFATDERLEVMRYLVLGFLSED